MEVTRRTAADRKGGHLARRKSDGRLLLREVAQCPEADLEAFQDIDKHRYFNTNSLWLRLDLLKEQLAADAGVLPLPMIRNLKTVDPRGAEIQLNDDVTGYLRASELSRDRVEDARNMLKEGDEVSVMIINVDRKARSIQLSIKAKDAADQQEQMQRLAQTSERENAGTTSLGALLRAKLDSNRE